MMMKKLLLSGLFVLLNMPLSAQIFESGMSLYNAGDYERAARVFEQLDEPRGQLFAAKSYYNLAQIHKALSYLKETNISDNFESEVSQDIQLTKALCQFELKNFAASLDLLYELKSSRRQSAIYFSGVRLYDQILDFLSEKQRLIAYEQSDYAQVRFDVIRSAVGKYNAFKVQQLISFFIENEPNPYRFPLGELENQLRDSTYQDLLNAFTYPKAPDGMMYNLGVALPTYTDDGAPFQVSRELYFGIMLAVEEFNSNNTDLKVFINYIDTESKPELAEQKISAFAWQHQSDIIIGPLFSEVLKSYSLQAERYEIPLLAPLANADSVSLYSNYTFQFNPTFEVQGRRMAEYAIQKLEYDSLAVLAESNGLGAASASAFRYRAQELGAHIAYYDVHNLEDQGYDIREYTQVFTPDTLLIDSLRYVPVDAVYAPFTGIAAQTLVESLLTDLEAMKSEVNILGSEEWENVDLDSRGMNDTNLSYTLSFDLGQDTLKIQSFESNYRLRFNRDPSLFSFIGYDVASIALENLLIVGNPEYLKNAMRFYRNRNIYTLDVDFGGKHVNQAVRIRDYYREEVIPDSLNSEVEGN
jgi:hypothetical protein